jgi:hypothetical protein
MTISIIAVAGIVGLLGAAVVIYFALRGTVEDQGS